MVDTVKLKIMVVMEGWEAEPGRCLEHDEGHAGGDQEGPGEGEAIFSTCPVSQIIIFCPKKLAKCRLASSLSLLSLPCADNNSARSNATSRKHWPIEEGSHLGQPIYQLVASFFLACKCKVWGLCKLVFVCICEDWFGKEVFIMWHLIQHKIRIHQMQRQLPPTKSCRCSINIV